MSETELVERLERLECAHRRLKGFALVALVLATALATIYATQPVPQTITAHEFDVVDNSGKQRASMVALSGGGSDIGLTDAQGNPGVIMNLDPATGASIMLLDAQRNLRTTLSVTREGAPTIELSDAQGFRMNLGTTGTVSARSGSTEQTSAASIVMFGNDEKHHVIWKAP